MFYNEFKADNSRFGAALTAVMKARGIRVSKLLGECKVKAQRVTDVKKG